MADCGREILVKDSTKSLSRNAVGIGFRPALYQEVLNSSELAIDFLEIISDNFLSDAALPKIKLQDARGRFPITMHSVGMNLLGYEDLDLTYLQKLKELSQLIGAHYLSDHLCWSGAEGRRHHDLLPMPYTEKVLEHAITRSRAVQDFLGIPFAIENLSTYVHFKDSLMTEWEFYSRVVRESQAYYLLDINNIFVSSHNHGFDPKAYLASIDFDRVLEVHLAGHSYLKDGSILDSHDSAVAEEVWDLYRYAVSLGGPFPTLIEWDENIPSLDIVLKEVDKAREINK